MKLLPLYACACGCGCGEVAKAENRFVHLHHPSASGWHHTEEWKQLNSIRMKGNKYALGNRFSEEAKRNLSNKRKGKKPNLGYKHTEEWKKNNSKLHKGRVFSEEHKRKIGEANKRTWSDLNRKDKRVEAILKASRIRPNKAEVSLLELLESLQPSDWKYVGDGNLIIAGKNPDFVNVNGKKLIIEMWGDFWHKGQDPQDRIDVFTPFGFSTLIVWEHELKNILVLTDKLNKFWRSAW